jgi:hypothetical protein
MSYEYVDHMHEICNKNYVPVQLCCVWLAMGVVATTTRHSRDYTEKLHKISAGNRPYLE